MHANTQRHKERASKENFLLFTSVSLLSPFTLSVRVSQREEQIPARHTTAKIIYFFLLFKVPATTAYYSEQHPAASVGSSPC